jgi:hypothetical protein
MPLPRTEPTADDRPVATAEIAAPSLARFARSEWDRLAAPTVRPAAFDPAMADSQPAAVRRWLLHALKPGVPLSESVCLTMNGRIKIGGWRRFTAVQVVAPWDGYIWAARSAVAGLPITGFDRYSSGDGEMRWRLLGLIPVVSVRGNDVTASAAGRLASEIVLIPTAFRSATWTAGVEENTFTAEIRIGSDIEQLELRTDLTGGLHTVRLQRWGNPNGLPFARYPFGVTVMRESTFTGVTIPSTVRAGWFVGTERESEGEFFRASITAAAFR